MTVLDVQISDAGWCNEKCLHFDCIIQPKGDVTRDDSQRRFLEQHSVATLEQCWNYSKQCRNNVATLCCPVIQTLKQGGGPSPNFFFGPSGLSLVKNKGEQAPRAPPLDPSLSSIIGKVQCLRQKREKQWLHHEGSYKQRARELESSISRLHIHIRLHIRIHFTPLNQ